MLRRARSLSRGDEAEPARFSSLAGSYFDEFYTRAISGSCVPAAPTERDAKKANKPDRLCGWGGAFGGGCLPDVSRAVVPRDLELARAALELYDAVLIVETVSSKAVMRWLQVKLGLPKTMKMTYERKGLVKGRSSTGSANPPPPDDALERLKRENSHDAALYTWARERQERDLAAFAAERRGDADVDDKPLAETAREHMESRAKAFFSSKPPPSPNSKPRFRTKRQGES